MGEEREVRGMVDPKAARLQLVKQILQTMGSSFEIEGESEIWVDADQWCIYLPEDEPSQVLLRFDHEIDNCISVDLALRFYGVARMLGLDVYSAADIYPDSTNSDSGLIMNVVKN
jgi:hypothetical protein